MLKIKRIILIKQKVIDHINITNEIYYDIKTIIIRSAFIWCFIVFLEISMCMIILTVTPSIRALTAYVIFASDYPGIIALNLHAISKSTDDM